MMKTLIKINLSQTYKLHLYYRNLVIIDILVTCCHKTLGNHSISKMMFSCSIIDQ